MRIIKTTDGRFIGTIISEVNKDDIIHLDEFDFEIVSINISGVYTTLSNSNYVIKLKQ